MARRALSITLDEGNVVWLRGRVAAGASASVSELVDQLVTEAKAAGRGAEAGMRSVAGTIDLGDADPELAGADAYIRAQFEASLQQPWILRESAPPRKRRRNRG